MSGARPWGLREEGLGPGLLGLREERLGVQTPGSEGGGAGVLESSVSAGRDQKSTSRSFLSLGVPGWRCAFGTPILSPNLGLQPAPSLPMCPGGGETLKAAELPTASQGQQLCAWGSPWGDRVTWAWGLLPALGSFPGGWALEG